MPVVSTRSVSICRATRATPKSAPRMSSCGCGTSCARGYSRRHLESAAVSRPAPATGEAGAMNERELLDAVGQLPKRIEPPRDLWPGIAARIDRRSWRRRLYWVPLAAAAALVLYLLARGERNAWDVTALAGRPLIGTTRLTASGRLRVGDWLQTDDSSRALIAVGRIGQVEVRPDTRVQLVVAKANEHRLALARGTIDAKVDAVPRLLFVETPARTAIDPGWGQA